MISSWRCLVIIGENKHLQVPCVDDNSLIIRVHGRKWRDSTQLICLFIWEELACEKHSGLLFCLVVCRHLQPSTAYKMGFTCSHLCWCSWWVSELILWGRRRWRGHFWSRAWSSRLKLTKQTMKKSFHIQKNLRLSHCLFAQVQRSIWLSAIFREMY